MYERKNQSFFVCADLSSKSDANNAGKKFDFKPTMAKSDEQPIHDESNIFDIVQNVEFFKNFEPCKIMNYGINTHFGFVDHTKT